MRIKDLADTSGVSAQTIRYYERQGLLPTPEREGNGYRNYDDKTTSRLRFIRSAQSAGLTLNDIGSIIIIRQEGHNPCEHVTALLTEKLSDVHARQQELAQLEASLKELIQANQALDPANCSPDSICQVIPGASLSRE